MQTATSAILQLQPAVFLDRDNTLIHNDGDLGDPGSVRLIDGVAAGLRALRDAGFRLIVVTNQGGVARGLFSEADVDSVHMRIAHLVDEAAQFPHLIDRFYYCPYHPEGTDPEYRREHPWRKPSPGMMLQAARDMHLDLASSWLIGDQPRDIAAGKAAGCRTIMIHGSDADAAAVHATAHAESFMSAVQTILNETSQRREPPNRNGVAAPMGRADAAPHDLRRAVLDLTDEIRSWRVSRGDLTTFKVLAGLAQLMALLCALLGLVQLQDVESFQRWLGGAILLQLMTVTLILLDRER